MTTLFSYVVADDTGWAPHPTGRYCTLVWCKYKENRRSHRSIVELAEKGDWVVGTGGVKNAGHGKLIYAMRMDEKLSLAEYRNDKRFASRFDAERDRKGRKDQYALISQHFSTSAALLCRFRHGFGTIRSKRDVKAFCVISTRPSSTVSSTGSNRSIPWACVASLGNRPLTSPGPNADPRYCAKSAPDEVKKYQEPTSGWEEDSVNLLFIGELMFAVSVSSYGKRIVNRSWEK